MRVKSYAFCQRKIGQQMRMIPANEVQCLLFVPHWRDALLWEDVSCLLVCTVITESYYKASKEAMLTSQLGDQRKGR